MKSGQFSAFYKGDFRSNHAGGVPAIFSEMHTNANLRYKWTQQSPPIFSLGFAELYLTAETLQQGFTLLTYAKPSTFEVKPLEGFPLPIKDCKITRGFLTGAGSGGWFPGRGHGNHSRTKFSKITCLITCAAGII